MIEIEHLTRRYGPRAVVNDVSLTVQRSEIVALVGTSGSGKTTLLRMINRLVEPSSGRVRIAGTDTATLPPHQLRRRIGYAIQGHGLFPHRSVAQNIATVPRLLGWDRARIDARVDELLDLFQLPPEEFRDRRPQELSGGQQQRVGVARALAARPELLLMDEPFGALDPVIRAQAQQDLRRIQRELGTTLLLVTHDMTEAMFLAHRIAVMDDGRLLQCAPARDILTRPASPLVQALAGEQARPFHLLSLSQVADLAQPGTAEGPPLAPETSLRDALAQCLWSGRDALPVAGGGVVTLAALRQAASGETGRTGAGASVKAGVPSPPASPPAPQ
ncbi:osmoprotectant transport system ATP-binding protein [Paracoccus solventivorans]|uniref:Osmoprotectant transport system ATP-binding protein n=1 Tax=Paracoccus solventivorans TaxID=53463 RepID=A0A1M7DY22_9RHOB|nr:ABC transporter ATP-binding protein [Paracoccus solventivorans]SHL84303.1 osmoprotectant transport system ATP-binding protein [Paracoccus solventivorans]